MIAMYDWTTKQLEENGFMQYEVSNFAKPGFESRHNSVYWQRSPYKGFGMGACSFDGESRFQTEKNLNNYLTIVEAAHDYSDLAKLSVMSETLTPQQAWLEQLMLGLRQKTGMPWGMIREKLSPTDYANFSAKK